MESLFTPEILEKLRDRCPDKDSFDREIQWELEMHEMGKARFWRLYHDAVEGGEASTTLAQQRLLRHAIEPVVEGIGDFLKKVKIGKAGRLSEAGSYLELFDPHIAAYIGIRTILDLIPTAPSFTQVCRTIGQFLEDEARLVWWKSQVEGKTLHLYNKIFSYASQVNTGRAHKRTVLIYAMGKYGYKWETWPTDMIIRIGAKLMEIIRDATGIVEVRNVRSSRFRNTVKVFATPKTIQWLEQQNEKLQLLCPVYMPMLVEPTDWTNPFDGGYLHHGLHPYVLIKTHRHNQIRDLEKCEMPSVYRAVNGLQRTPFRVNPTVWQVVTELVKTGGTAGLPTMNDLPLPPKPHDIATNEKARRDWRHQAKAVYDQQVTLTGRRICMLLTYQLGERMKSAKEFYYPLTLDYRGRLYCQPTYLTYQNNDMARGAVEFARGYPISNDLAAWHLAVHGANMYGMDKMTLDERFNWTATNKEMIADIARHPMDCNAWYKADKPFQFLAFCLDWQGMMEKGKKHISHLPTLIDGTCNGIQIFSALLRDEVGGRAVNLVPDARQHDIYGEVAEAVTAALKADGGNPFAKAWLWYGVNRGTVKRSVMTLPYGSTRHASRQFIEDSVKDRIEAHDPPPDAIQGDIFAATNYLNFHVWQAIESTVASARKVMDWLRSVAKQSAKADKSVKWTLANGFSVIQEFRQSVKHLATAFGDTIYQLHVPSDEDKMNIGRQVSSISPNFVHSLDAAVLMATVNKCLDAGITDMVVVHDCYGCHAANMEELHQFTRESFVELFTQHDPLAEFAEQVQARLKKPLPPLPPKGKLNIEDVLQSDYFFS